MTNVNQDLVGDLLQDENFTIVDLEVDTETDETTFIIIHNLHPEDEVRIKLVTNKDAKEEGDGEDAMQLQFTGPDQWTDDEAKQVLHEVMDVITKIIEKAIEDHPIPETIEDSGSGSGSDQ